MWITIVYQEIYWDVQNNDFVPTSWYALNLYVIETRLQIIKIKWFWPNTFVESGVRKCDIFFSASLRIKRISQLKSKVPIKQTFPQWKSLLCVKKENVYMCLYSVILWVLQHIWNWQKSLGASLDARVLNRPVCAAPHLCWGEVTCGPASRF